jgi:hypothetical protein
VLRAVALAIDETTGNLAACRRRPARRARDIRLPCWASKQSSGKWRGDEVLNKGRLEVSSIGWRPI